MGVLEDIYDAVVAGNVADAAKHVVQGLNSKMKVDEILKKGLISAMDLVGQRFAEGEIFIPHVIWSAKAMQAGMDLIKPYFTGSNTTTRARIIIGTAQGDIHDIGKNLVAMMLEGAGFEVFDLGVDVKAERFVEKAVAEKANIIAISALLTTTMMNMADVVELIQERALTSIKVLIGGAPLSEEFCQEIGAHAYGVDAKDAVTKTRGLLNL